MEYLLFGLGFALVLEGLVYALAPRIVEDLLAALRALPPETRRLLGLVAISIGAVFLWAASALGL
ncbi:DUF2065 domain-containing protein [Rhodosalinus sp. FB01]|uniref:DUF2065 domain-containing protein n=1 Tax=Rhodosalinus sp. FB01 TaxID=3239194 RepID=UPI00352493DC